MRSSTTAIQPLARWQSQLAMQYCYFYTELIHNTVLVVLLRTTAVFYRIKSQLVEGTKAYQLLAPMPKGTPRMRTKHMCTRDDDVARSICTRIHIHTYTVSCIMEYRETSLYICSKLTTMSSLSHTDTYTRTTSVSAYKTFQHCSHLYIDVNESRHTYMYRFINIYLNMDNARKSYNMKWRKYIDLHTHIEIGTYNYACMIIYISLSLSSYMGYITTILCPCLMIQRDSARESFGSLFCSGNELWGQGEVMYQMLIALILSCRRKHPSKHPAHTIPC